MDNTDTKACRNLHTIRSDACKHVCCTKTSHWVRLYAKGHLLRTRNLYVHDIVLTMFRRSVDKDEMYVWGMPFMHFKVMVPYAICTFSAIKRKQLESKSFRKFYTGMISTDNQETTKSKFFRFHFNSILLVSLFSDNSYNGFLWLSCMKVIQFDYSYFIRKKELFISPSGSPVVSPGQG